MSKGKERQRVVFRFRDGRVLKGFMDDFSTSASTLSIADAEGQVADVGVSELKAVFFVKDFAGDSSYKDRKLYGLTSGPRGRKVLVRFFDAEILLGYMEDDIPWPEGFFLSKPNVGVTGFFIYPTDAEGNNLKVYVINSSVEDVTRVG